MIECDMSSGCPRDEGGKRVETLGSSIRHPKSLIRDDSNLIAIDIGCAI